MTTKKFSAREYAAVTYALATARGYLYSVKIGTADRNELERIIAGTSAANIAKALGLDERDLSIDWPDCLTQSEMDAIRYPTDTGASS